jgi:hypothetical protein
MWTKKGDSEINGSEIDLTKNAIESVGFTWNEY